VGLVSVLFTEAFQHYDMACLINLFDSKLPTNPAPRLPVCFALESPFRA
jgi:hypothetical protein